MSWRGEKWVISSLVFLLTTGCGSRCYLKPDEQVNFYPGYAYPQATGSGWVVVMHGQVVRPDPKGLFSNGTLQALSSLALLVPDMSQAMLLLEERLKPFVAEGRADKAVPIVWKDQKHTLPASGQDGSFEESWAVPAQAISPTTGWMDVTTAPCKEDARRFSERVRVIPDQGLSVVSGIEDTIKTDSVGDEHDQLVNTFLREYHAVPGMAERYAAWGEQGAVFHYVSPSPWQLSPALETFMKNSGFPEGTMHLKTLPLGTMPDSLASLVAMITRVFQPSAAFKTPLIEELLQRFPHRRFILVGTTRNHDPEVYAALARRHPGQIQAIYLRKAPAEPGATPLHEVFQGVPNSLWKVFSNPTELKATL